MRLLTLLIIFLFLNSCSGYRFTRRDNPFLRYGIKSISIPMFLNRSNLPMVSAVFTSEVYQVLSKFTGLKIHMGDSAKTDAVLVGIVGSPKYRRDTIQTTSTAFSDQVQNQNFTDSQGRKRPPFNIPQNKRVRLHLTLVLIKDPTHQKLEMIKSGELSPILKNLPEVIFYETLGEGGGYSSNIYGNSSYDTGSVVNWTQAKANRERSIRGMARSSASKFERLIIYAF